MVVASGVVITFLEGEVWRVKATTVREGDGEREVIEGSGWLLLGKTGFRGLEGCNHVVH